MALSIIGTAGRGTDAPRIKPDIYNAMFGIMVETAIEWRENHGVSGGAAVADHLAVRGFLEGVFNELTLYLPAEFSGGTFVPNPNIQFNPGRTLVNFHKAFSAACNIDSLGEIEEAIRLGAHVEVHPGFKTRNNEVAANCTSMLAMTFGVGDRFSGQGNQVYGDFLESDAGFRSSAKANLKDGGTAHTWGECWRAERKRHVNLTLLEHALSAELAADQVSCSL